MEFREKIANYSIKHYRHVTLIMIAFTLITGAFIPFISVDTDPENMLSKNEPVRVFHKQTKKGLMLI